MNKFLRLCIPLGAASLMLGASLLLVDASPASTRLPLPQMYSFGGGREGVMPVTTLDDELHNRGW